MTRCAECGIEQSVALGSLNTHCAPPFHRQPHDFSGLHPADMAEADQASLRRVQERLKPHFNDGSKQAHEVKTNVNAEYGKMKPLDTTTLGRIALDPGSDNVKARMVREALDRAARTLWDRSQSTRDDWVVKGLRDASHYADEETMLSIYRMLRS